MKGKPITIIQHNCAKTYEVLTSLLHYTNGTADIILVQSPGWLLMALLTPTLPLSLYFLILVIMRDLELLPMSANLDLTFFVLTDLTFLLTLMVIFSHFRF